MAENSAERLQRLLGGSAGTTHSLPGATPTTARGPNSEAFKPTEGNTRIYFVKDVTYSMEPYIKAVQTVASNVGRQTLHAEKGIEATVIGVNEHQRAGFTPSILQHRGRPGINIHGDFLQYYPWTTNPEQLQTQVANLILETKSNGDVAEPYECAAKFLVDQITADRKLNPDRTYGVVFFGDAMPHGAKGLKTPFLVSLSDMDAGCVHGVHADELENLINVANRVYWVDCDQRRTGDFKKYTYDPLSRRESSIYVKFADAQGILEQALVGMVKQTVSPVAFKEYLASLPSATATSVRGLLGNGQ